MKQNTKNKIEIMSKMICKWNEKMLLMNRKTKKKFLQRKQQNDNEKTSSKK